MYVTYFEHVCRELHVRYLGHQTIGCRAAVLDVHQEVVGGPLLAVQAPQLPKDELAATVRIHAIVCNNASFAPFEILLNGRLH